MNFNLSPEKLEELRKLAEEYKAKAAAPKAPAAPKAAPKAAAPAAPKAAAPKVPLGLAGFSLTPEQLEQIEKLKAQYAKK